MLQLMANISVDFALSNFYREIQCNSYKGAFRNPGFPRQTQYTIRRNLISLRVHWWKRRFTTKIIFHKRTVPLSLAADLQGHETSVSHRSPQSIKIQRCTSTLSCLSARVYTYARVHVIKRVCMCMFAVAIKR